MSTGAPAATLDPADDLAVRRTLARYALALDEHDLEALGSVLGEDVTWTFRFGDDPPLDPVAGRGAVLDLARTSMAAETVRRRHVLGNLAVDAFGNGRAVVRATLVLTASDAGRSRVVTTGAYRLVLARAAGGWLVEDLVLHTDGPVAG